MEEELVESPSTLCRVCFNIGCFKIQSHELIINNEKVELKTALSKLSSLEISEDDNVPEMICMTCVDQLGQCFMFLEKLHKADEHIKQLKLYGPESPIYVENENDYEYIECEEDIEEIEDTESEHELSIQLINKTEPEKILIKEHDFNNMAVNKKRVNNNKKPNLVLTENVTNILSNVNQTDSDSEEPPVKILKTEGNSFMVTKFVLTEPTNVPDYLDREDGDCSQTINKVRMFDMTAVEVKASEKIEMALEEETFFESPNTMYICKYCPKAFSTSHHLIMHTRKSHVCQFCMKGFSKSTELYNHSREAHNNFACTLCKKDFSSNSNLRQHMKRVHNVQIPAYVSLLSFKKNDNV